MIFTYRKNDSFLCGALWTDAMVRRTYDGNLSVKYNDIDEIQNQIRGEIRQIIRANSQKQFNHFRSLQFRA